jgi:hypothetical protein
VVTVAPDQLPTSRFAELDHRDVARFYAVNWLRAVMALNFHQALRMAIAVDRARFVAQVPTELQRTSSTPHRAGPANADGSVWGRLAACEASGDWRANTGNGFEGGLQFTPSTWHAYGGTGHAYDATPAQQIAVAERVLASQGPSAWPVCSYRAGLR